MKKVFFMLILVAMLFIYGCGKPEKLPISNEEQNNSEATTPNNANQEDNNFPMENADTLSDFSIKIGEGKASLLDWDHEIDFEDLFGKPIHEEIRQLGSGSDTFEGSYIKRLQFTGIELELFSPKDNGNSFFILSMEVRDRKYQTARGIKVGDNLEDLHKAYPEIKPILDNRSDMNNRGYMIEEGAYNYITFEVQQGVIVKIKIYHEFA